VRIPTRLFLGISGSFVVALTAIIVLTHVGSSATPPNGAVAVDCNAGTAGVQATCTYAVGATFSIQVNVTKPPTGGYYGFQMKTRWETVVLDYLPNSSVAAENLWSNCDFPGRFNNEPGGPPNDPDGRASVLYACAQSDDPRIPETAAGPILQFQFQCRPGVNGVSSLTLVPQAGDLQLGSHFLDQDDNTIDPSLVAASVTCGTAPTATPTPPPNTATPTNTSPPVDTATPTNTAPPTNTPTDTPTSTITNTPTNTPTSTDTATPTDTPLPVPTVTGTPPKLPPPGDTDGDGCADAEENGPDHRRGGQRNYTSFWDFFDVPTPPGYTRDKAVSVGDIAAVVARFGTQRTPPPTKQEAYAEALLPPAPLSPPPYHPAYDRTLAGPEPWDSGPPNGSVTVEDIFLIVQQFGDTCMDAP
jgi:hypothetical protein